MITLEAIVLYLTYVIDVIAISTILITMGQLLLLLLRRALVVDSKKSPARKFFFNVFMKQVNVISNDSTSEPKISIIPILANGLLFALEFECANAVLRLILVISSIFRDGPNLDIYNTIIFFVGIFAIRIITLFTLKKFDL